MTTAAPISCHSLRCRIMQRNPTWLVKLSTSACARQDKLAFELGETRENGQRLRLLSRTPWVLAIAGTNTNSSFGFERAYFGVESSFSVKSVRSPSSRRLGGI